MSSGIPQQAFMAFLHAPDESGPTSVRSRSLIIGSTPKCGCSGTSGASFVQT